MIFHPFVRIAAFSSLLISSEATAAIFDWEAPRTSDHVMALKCYLPEGLESARAIIVVVPGLNADGRSQALDKEWSLLAQRTGCALIGCFIKGSQGGSYYEVNNWSGDLFLKGLRELARLSNHSEIESAALGFWGHSAGGQWNYNFACWKPNRTFAFIANKGAYYQGTTTAIVREVPALWIAGEKDTDERIGNITSLYAENRRRGAPWSLLIEPAVNHAVGRSKEIGMTYLEDALSLRINPGGHLHPVDGSIGWLGNFQNHEVVKNTALDYGPATNTWLPGKPTADLWRSISLGAQQQAQPTAIIQTNNPAN
jgi:hypothetical protein